MAERRILSWEGFHNARDLGGLRTAGGRTTRYGALIRSGDVRFVTAAGWRSAFDAGVRTIIDLRNDDEAEPGSGPGAGATAAAGTFTVPATGQAAGLPAGMQVLRIPLDDIGDLKLWRWLNEQRLNGTPRYFRPFMEAKPQRCAAVLTAIARAQPAGVIYHCIEGCDRTGLITLLVLSLAGVVPEEIAADYELSLDLLAPLHAALDVSPPSKRAAIEAHGSTVQATVFGALDGLDVMRLLGPAGFSEADAMALRARLLRDENNRPGSPGVQLRPRGGLPFECYAEATEVRHGGSPDYQHDAGRLPAHHHHDPYARLPRLRPQRVRHVAG